MRKIIALILSLTVCFGIFSTFITSADDFTPILRFTVFSDVHIALENDERCTKVENAIKYSYAYAKDNSEYDKLDAIVIVGDIGHGGEDRQWGYAKDVILPNVDTDETSLMVLMGNHEFKADEDTAENRFISVFGDVNGGANASRVNELNAVNAHYTLNGIHFITISPDMMEPWDHPYSEDKVTWVEKQLEIAQADTGKDKPIFVFQHIGNLDTVLGTKVAVCEQFNDIFSKYPQVVNFSGHSHCPINNEASVWQGGYTAFGTGAFQNAIMPHYNSLQSHTVDKNEDEIDQFYIVEIDADGTTRVTMHDGDEKKQVGETYFIDSYDPADFKYVPDRLNKFPFKFSDDALLSVNDAAAHKLSFTFTPVKQDCLTATAYHFIITDSGGNSVYDACIGTAYYDEGEDDVTAEIGGILPALKEGMEYTLTLEGVNTAFIEKIDERAYHTENKLSTKFHFGDMPAPSPESESESDIIIPQDPPPDNDYLLIIGICIGVVIIAAAVVLIILKKKKK